MFSDYVWLDNTIYLTNTFLVRFKLIGYYSLLSVLLHNVHANHIVIPGIGDYNYMRLTVERVLVVSEATFCE